MHAERARDARATGLPIRPPHMAVTPEPGWFLVMNPSVNGVAFADLAPIPAPVG